MYKKELYRAGPSVPSVVTNNPSQIELDEAPFPQEWVLAGKPQARAKLLAHSNDRGMNVIVWSCTPGRFCWKYDVDEVVQILSGEVIITDHTGREFRLGSGDTAFFPAGSCSTWHVLKDVRKVAVCRNAVPRSIELGLGAWRRLRRFLHGARAAVTRNRLRVEAGSSFADH